MNTTAGTIAGRTEAGFALLRDDSAVGRIADASAPGRAGLIELTIRKPDQLFHSLDPSPLISRGLDDRIEDFILEAAREAPGSRYELVIHLPGELPSRAEAEALGDAARSHFAERREETSRKLRSLMREGRQAIAVGLLFLFVCGILGAFAEQIVPAPLGSFLNEGLLIIGWVANWRPVEIFLYDWRPLRRQRDLFGALARMPVAFRSAGA